MLKRYHQTVSTAFRLLDAVILSLCWLLAYWLRFDLQVMEVTKGIPPFERYVALLPLVIFLWMIVFSWLEVYQFSKLLRRTHEVQRMIKAHLLALAIFMSLTYLFVEFRYSRLVMLLFGTSSAVLLVFFRLTMRNLLRSIRRRGVGVRKVLLVGEAAISDALVHKMERFPELGLQVVGAVVAPESEAQQVAGKPVMGRFDDIQNLVKEEGIDQVLIALKRSQSEDLDRILGRIHDETVDIQLVPDLHEFMALGCEVEDFDGLPMVNLNDSPLDGWGAWAKRMTDLLLSALALLILSPLLLLLAVLTKLSSPGPIFYSQERMGLDGRTFKMYKFRSMKMDAEKDSGAVWAKEDDPRRTAFGSFLRASSLDELPQFWNVFLGHMALVGPRPERPVFVEKFRSEIPHYMLRHKVKAGITGWAQVNGWRGNTSLNKRIECDLYYIRNWSYGFDILILFMTVWRGFINRNAY